MKYLELIERGLRALRQRLVDWCGSIKVVSRHCSPYLETMAVNLRPFWSPREISWITLLIVYAVIFESTSASVAKETTDAIHSQIDVLEKKEP